MAQIVVNEKSSLFLVFSFTDEEGAPVIPTTIDWRVDKVDDPHNPVQIQDWTAIGVPAATVSVQIAGNVNTISDQTKTFEHRAVTVRMDESLSTIAHQEKLYRIKNLSAAP